MFIPGDAWLLIARKTKSSDTLLKLRSVCQDANVAIEQLHYRKIENWCCIKLKWIIKQNRRLGSKYGMKNANELVELRDDLVLKRKGILSNNNVQERDLCSLLLKVFTSLEHIYDQFLKRCERMVNMHSPCIQHVENALERLKSRVDSIAESENYSLAILTHLRYAMDHYINCVTSSKKETALVNHWNTKRNEMKRMCRRINSKRVHIEKRFIVLDQ